jgi:copper oxidase (laccase) domain-containing protein
LAIPKRLRYRPRVTEAFPFLAPLNVIPGIRAGWVERVSGLTITGDRDEAMSQLRPIHESAVANFSPAAGQWWRAEQVHGNAVAVVPGSPTMLAPDGLPVVPGVDGLITAEPGIVLAIYVADCGAIWLADRKTGAIGLLHSGKKGTESNIFQHALDLMGEQFGTRSEDVTAVLGPCIRPPDYDVDFAAEIGRQADVAGVGNFIDCQLNTGSDLVRFYSYRKELGKTGRMMALLVRDSPP